MERRKGKQNAREIEPGPPGQGDDGAGSVMPGTPSRISPTRGSRNGPRKAWGRGGGLWRACDGEGKRYAVPPPSPGVRPRLMKRPFEVSLSALETVGPSGALRDRRGRKLRSNRTVRLPGSRAVSAAARQGPSHVPRSRQQSPHNALRRLSPVRASRIGRRRRVVRTGGDSRSGGRRALVPFFAVPPAVCPGHNAEIRRKRGSAAVDALLMR